jgi:hypothetical protein
MAPRVQRVGHDALGAPSAGGLDGEEHVAGLRLAVRGPAVVFAVGVVDVVVDDVGHEVGVGRDRHHPGAAGRGEGVVQAQGQREVAEIIGTELKFVALGGCPPVRHGHDSGVVDQNVQRARPCPDERADRVEVGQVERGGLDLSGEFAGQSAGRGRVPGRDGHLGAGRGQGARRLPADAGGAAGHHGAFAGEVDTGQNLAGGAGEAERRSDQI